MLNWRIIVGLCDATMPQWEVCVYPSLLSLPPAPHPTPQVIMSPGLSSRAGRRVSASFLTYPGYCKYQHYTPSSHSLLLPLGPPSLFCPADSPVFLSASLFYN